MDKLKELLDKAKSFVLGMDRKQKIIALSSAAALIVVIVLCAVLLHSCGQNTPPAPTTTGPASTETTYSVIVKDASGKPYTAGVIVKFMQNGQQAAMQPVNGNGVAEKVLPNGEYTIELEFTSAANAASYDAAGAVVTTEKPQLEIVLMNTVSGETTALFTTSPVTGEGRQYDAYRVIAGDTNVPLEANERSFFLFSPTEAGTYEISVTGENIQLGYYGAPHFVQAMSIEEVVDNTFTVSINAGMIGTNGTGTTTLVIGIDSADASAVNCVLSIERIGEPAWSIDQEPWTEYKTTFDLKPFVMGSGSSVKEFDLTADTDAYTLVLGEDGCYHLDSEDGPLVLVRLGEKSAYLESYKKMLETTGIKRYFYDDKGEFVKKEDYSGILMDYIECMDEVTGLYPLTEDLKYIIQNSGEHMGWWDPDGYYIFVDEDGNKIPGINNEIAWLFMCCYDESNAGSFEDTPVAPETTVPETTVPPTTVPPTTVPPTTAAPTEPRPVETKPQQTKPVETKPVVTVPPTTAAPTTVPSTTAHTEHNYDDGKVTKEPTCTAEGVKTYTCTVCTDSYTEAIPMLTKHTYAAGAANADGSVPYACKSCGQALGTLVNADMPQQAGGFLSYTTANPTNHEEFVDVQPGTMWEIWIYKLNGAYVTISDPDAYIVYNNEVYRPVNGAVSVFATTDSMNNPVKLLVGNNGTEAKPFTLTVGYPAGSQTNPIALPMGAFTAEIAEGNEQGVYYTWTATQNGTLTIKLAGVPSGVKADFRVTKMSVAETLQWTLAENGVDGVLTVEVKAGDTFELLVGIIPDDSFEYVGASVNIVTTFA